ncbi:metal ABC transporter permease, partial [uncultured Alistipes sp.]
ELFCHRFATMMRLSALISLACCIGGLLLATVIDVPCSALIVIVMAAAYVVPAAVMPVVRRLARRS